MTSKIIINKPKESSTLWKYLDLHRFIYLLNTPSLFFTRLDKFDDPYEGLSTKTLRNRAETKAKLLEVSLPKKDKYKIKIIEKVLDKDFDTESKTFQTHQFVNCWFSGNRESMAMWNLYSNRDSIALKIDFENLISSLDEGFQNYIEIQSHNIKIIGDSITYLELNPFNPNLPKQNFAYAGLKKDVSFDYEKEYRFLIVFISQIKKPIPFITIPLDISKLRLEVITHPNMEPWKYSNIKTLLSKSNINFNLKKSDTLLRTNNG